MENQEVIVGSSQTISVSAASDTSPVVVMSNDDNNNVEVQSSLTSTIIGTSNTAQEFNDACSDDDFLFTSGGTMVGKLIAQPNADYETAQVRNITQSTQDPTGGHNGDIWIKIAS